MKLDGRKYSVDIPLDIAVDYPIGWNFERALRDFIQNFYDEVGSNHFAEKCKYKYSFEKNGKIKLSISICGDGFSYELLSHIGASTKTDDVNTIGKYGEGFKMACLSIYKMKGMVVTMHSQDWMITPASYDITIDGSSVEMFGYHLDRVENDGNTELTISGIPIDKEYSIQNALLEFFYPENQLFLGKIGEGAGYSVYGRSNAIIPCGQYDPNLNGVLYINNLARGRLEIPLAVNYICVNHSDRRSRPTLNKFDTTRILYHCIEKWDADTSAKVLRLLRKHWSEQHSIKKNYDTNYYYICQLVRNIVKDKTIADSFKKEMEDVCYLEKKTRDKARNTIIDEALQWWMTNKGKRQVNPIFRLLGAESIVDTYLAQNEEQYRGLRADEEKKWGMLTTLVTYIVPYISEDDLPKAVIDITGNERFAPLQFAERVYGGANKSKGKRYKIRKLVLKEADFGKTSFNDTFLKVSEAVLQTYGSSRSEKYNSIFTALGRFIMIYDEVISQVKNKWEEM